MNRKDYEKKRDELMNAATAAVDAGKLDDSKEIRAQIEKLDADFDAAQKEMANIEALKKNRDEVKDIAAGGREPADGVPAEKMNFAKPKPTPQEEAKAYEPVFAKFLLGRQLSDAERDILSRNNPLNAANTAESNKVVIPTTLRDGIWTEIRDQHPILSDVPFTFVPGDVEIVAEDNNGDAAAWYDEATAVADGTVSFKTVMLHGYELAKAVPVSWKLKKMSVTDFLPYIANLVADKMSAALAAAVLNGKGVPASGESNPWKSEPRGIIPALLAESGTPQVLTYTVAEGIDYANMTSAMAVIKSKYAAGAKIYATNGTIWTKLANIKDTQKRPIFIPDATLGGVGRIFGLTVFEEDAVADGAVLIGNVGAGYAMNLQEQISMYSEEHVKERITDYMGYTIADGAPLTTKAFAYIKTSA